MIGLSVFCVLFYAAAFLFELSRFFFSGIIRQLFAIVCVLIAFVLHTIFLYYHHVAARDCVNGAEVYFFMTSWSLVLIYFYLSCYHRGVPFGLFFLPISLMLIIGGVIIAHITPNEPTTGLVAYNPPVLKMFHAITFFLATSSICIGFVAGLLYLVQDWRLKHKRPVGILRLPAIEWSASICRKALGASTLILAATIYFGWLMQPQSKSPNLVLLYDPLVIGTLCMFVFLTLFSGILPLQIFKTEGKQVAVLTLITFIFLILTLCFATMTQDAHWKRIKPKESPNPAFEIVNSDFNIAK
ncbi:MAG: hypothetical protein LBT09_09920 [Planctomycetaceae bacterium]|jgi:hypothetical protein|nr:hypothetical protein [Planctomycetaceae bacterium]